MPRLVWEDTFDNVGPGWDEDIWGPLVRPYDNDASVDTSGWFYAPNCAFIWTETAITDPYAWGVWNPSTGEFSGHPDSYVDFLVSFKPPDHTADPSEWALVDVPSRPERTFNKNNRPGSATASFFVDGSHHLIFAVDFKSTETVFKLQNNDALTAYESFVLPDSEFSFPNDGSTLHCRSRIIAVDEGFTAPRLKIQQKVWSGATEPGTWDVTMTRRYVTSYSSVYPSGTPITYPNDPTIDPTPLRYLYCCYATSGFKLPFKIEEITVKDFYSWDGTVRSASYTGSDFASWNLGYPGKLPSYTVSGGQGLVTAGAFGQNHAGTTLTDYSQCVSMVNQAAVSQGFSAIPVSFEGQPNFQALVPALDIAELVAEEEQAWTHVVADVAAGQEADDIYIALGIYIDWDKPAGEYNINRYTAPYYNPPYHVGYTTTEGPYDTIGAERYIHNSPEFLVVVGGSGYPGELLMRLFRMDNDDLSFGGDGGPYYNDWWYFDHDSSDSLHIKLTLTPNKVRSIAKTGTTTAKITVPLTGAAATIAASGGRWPAFYPGTGSNYELDGGGYPVRHMFGEIVLDRLAVYVGPEETQLRQQHQRDGIRNARRNSAARSIRQGPHNTYH
jgi:hypothetical protein